MADKLTGSVRIVRKKWEIWVLIVLHLLILNLGVASAANGVIEFNILDNNGPAGQNQVYVKFYINFV